MDWIRAFRVHQWAKNAIIFVPLFLGHRFFDQAAIVATILGFLLLNLATAGNYVLNDLADLEADRAHPTKRNRPFAAGRLSVVAGLTVSVVLIAGALVAAFLLSPPFAVVLAAYLGLALAYSFGVKQVPLLDVIVIATLFTLRIVMGIALADVLVSPWLLSFSLLFFFSLALAKRHAELIQMDAESTARLAGRGYHAEDRPLTLTFGVSSALAAVVTMVLYITLEAFNARHYSSPGWLYVAPFMTMVWVCRIWVYSQRGLLMSDPVAFTLKDPYSLLLGAITAIAFVLAL